MTTTVEDGTGKAIPATSTSDVMTLFLRLLPQELFEELRHQEGLRRNNRVYTECVVIWLMVVQRLQGNGTLSRGVLELARGLPDSFWGAKRCARLESGPDGKKPRLSSNTGSYNEARQALPVAIVEKCCDRALEQLLRQRAGAAGRREFLLDGTSVRTAHSKSLCELYPPGSNQHGESHWPMIRMLVAHDLDTGLALRPTWGPMYGDEAVSEQGLLEQIIARLPDDAAVLGDINFGVFSVAYAATQKRHPVVLRMSEGRARRLIQGEWVDSMEERVTWRPTPYERRQHPELPADACVEGRLIARQVQPSDASKPILLMVFTTLEEPAGEVIAYYGKRWNIEVDLRTLKSTLQLEQLNSTSPQMVAKEMDVGMLAYNLVRALMCMAAQRAELKPRNFSFTRVQNVLEAFAPLIAAAEDQRQAEAVFEKMMYYVGQAKLSRRNRTRNSYPRVAWGRPRVYPKPKA